ncbi:hypothetical protein BpHYR1_046385 [Brachionus plicatilis]|uniref:Uncharacterized protein n=1 Tax=Brachionus plicatilis TaxID=10195 RepID=A0A3M7R0V6_BRAPC|nr:hypothetical protein BpHYR1_046385 [Brachionus plicatilis]
MIPNVVAIDGQSVGQILKLSLELKLNSTKNLVTSCSLVNVMLLKSNGLGILYSGVQDLQNIIRNLVAQSDQLFFGAGLIGWDFHNAENVGNVVLTGENLALFSIQKTFKQSELSLDYWQESCTIRI